MTTRRVDALREEQRGTAVPEIVKADLWELRIAHQPVEMVGDVDAIQGAASGGGAGKTRREVQEALARGLSEIGVLP